MPNHWFRRLLRHTVFLLSGVAFLPVAPCLHAQQSSIVKLIVEKKPGASEGRAMATVKGPVKQKGKLVVAEKTGRIASQALQAWTIMDSPRGS